MTASTDDDLLRFGERVLFLLQHASRTTTYKYAVLLGLIDVCIEAVGDGGLAPTTITTRQLAERVAWLYWHHTEIYEDTGKVLRQSTGKPATIIGAIETFRREHRNAEWFRARSQDPEAFARLVDEIEWILVRDPLPRLQRVGAQEIHLLYRIPWGPQGASNAPSRTQVRAYQRGRASDFDNRILLLPGVGDALVRLAGLLRPVIEREWASMVAQINGLPAARLERFLFAPQRTTLEPLRRPLREWQNDRCFYCDGRLRSSPEIDHFIPFSRHPNDGVANLVLAHAGCNRAKLDFLAAPEHLDRWRRRNWDRHGRPTADLLHVAEAARMDADAHTTLGSARAIYLNLPAGVPLWRGPGRDDFVSFDERSRGIVCRALR